MTHLLPNFYRITSLLMKLGLILSIGCFECLSVCCALLVEISQTLWKSLCHRYNWGESFRRYLRKHRYNFQDACSKHVHWGLHDNASRQVANIVARKSWSNCKHGPICGNTYSYFYSRWDSCIELWVNWYDNISRNNSSIGQKCIWEFDWCNRLPQSLGLRRLSEQLQGCSWPYMPCENS